MTRAPLDPCPFCGAGDADGLDVLQTLDALHAGVCRICEAQGPPKATIGEAIVAWNDRPEIQDVTETP